MYRTEVPDYLTSMYRLVLASVENHPSDPTADPIEHDLEICCLVARIHLLTTSTWPFQGITTGTRSGDWSISENSTFI